MRALRNSLIIVGAVFIVAVLAIVGTKLFSDPSRSVNEAQSESATSPAVRGQVSPAQKGSWTATAQGVPVYLPDNEDGEVLTEELAASEMKACDPMSNPRAPEGNRVEQVHDRYLVFSTTDGPSRIEDGVPVGYAHTPAGAMVAYYNASAAIAPIHEDGSHDPLSKKAWNRLIEPGLDLDSIPVSKGIYSRDEAAFPFFFRVVGCNDETVTVEFANAYFAGGEPIAAVRAQMVWIDDDWKINREAPMDVRVVTSEEVKNWTRVKIG